MYIILHYFVLCEAVKRTYEKNERTGLQMHAPGNFAVTWPFRYDVDLVPSSSGRQVQTGEEHSCPC